MIFFSYEFTWILYLFCIISYIFFVRLLFKKHYFAVQGDKLKHIVLITLNVIVIVSAFIALHTLSNIDLAIINISPNVRDLTISFNQPITFMFSTAVDFKKLKTYSHPQTLGHWTYVRYVPFLPYGRSVTFTPDTQSEPNQKIMLYLSNMAKPLQTAYGSEYLLEFTPQQSALPALPKQGFNLLPKLQPPSPTPTPTPQPESVQLKVPMYYQSESFTCNIAAARMLLSYRGISKTEAELKAETGTNGRRGNGNPHKGYTGGYGTYWEPVAKMVAMHRNHQVYTNWNLEDLLAEVAKGNPVMTWGQNGWSDPHEISWTNPDGEKIYAINGMHSVVVTGFIGPRTKPTTILINDPWRGSYGISPAEFMRRWSYFKVALAVY